MDETQTADRSSILTSGAGAPEPEAPAPEPAERAPSVDEIADRIADQCVAIIGDQPDAVRNQVMGRLRNHFGG